VSRYLDALRSNYEEPVTRIYFYWIKAIIGSLYIWKLLSRDFSNVSIWPESVLAGYPVDIYKPDYVLTTGVWPIFDISSFHFIHWVLPWPSASNLQTVQILAVLSASVFIFCSEKYTQAAAVCFYALISYLWGFVFRLGQDIDAVFLIQGSLLMFAIIPARAEDQYYRNLRFSILIVFVLYYFSSGINKVIDLSYIEWAKYDLVNINSSKHAAGLNEHYWLVPKLPLSEGELARLLNFSGALITYAVHLGAPLLLFSRSTAKIVVYWGFYSLFHFMTLFVGILFTMNFFAWMLILPIYRWTNYGKR
jgi:hypothetical protein